MVTNYKDAIKDIIEPAILGTENVLNSVNKTESVQRVVVTSSIASTYGDAIDILQTEHNEFDESHWNTSQLENASALSVFEKLWQSEKHGICKKHNTAGIWSVLIQHLVMGPSLTASTTVWKC